MKSDIRTILRNFSQSLIFVAIVAAFVGLVELYQYLVNFVW